MKITIENYRQRTKFQECKHNKLISNPREQNTTEKQVEMDNKTAECKSRNEK
ncbi:hypothetical protein HYD57_00690 [Mycoplasmopsis bovis]|nr:hypothetical protein [Mycoplasmopsis bovis]QQH66262.1 hypothetical protein HYD57_00690 [Mycoplasmopsis bovis]